MREALRQEGLTDDQITVEKDTIIANDDGFISYRMEHGMPYITHYLVYREKRKNPMAWLDLYKLFKAKLKELGYPMFIAEVIPGKERFESFIKYYHGYKYAEVEGRKYYLVRV